MAALFSYRNCQCKVMIEREERRLLNNDISKTLNGSLDNGKITQFEGVKETWKLNIKSMLSCMEMLEVCWGNIFIFHLYMYHLRP